MRVLNLKKLSSNYWVPLSILALTLALSFILYAPAIKSYFVSEDLRHVTFRWSEVHDEFFSLGQSIGYRPGTTLYLVLKNFIWGRNQILQHATDFLLHGIVGWFVFLIVRRVTNQISTGLLAAILFVAAPLNTEGVIWMAAAAIPNP